MKRNQLPPRKVGLGIASLVLLFALFFTLVHAPVEYENARQTAASNAPISPEVAIVRALNKVTPMENGFYLKHPRHEAHFTAEGVRFTPRGGGPEWRWQLQSLGTESPVLQNVAPSMALPAKSSDTIIRYERGGVDEQYVVKKNTIEQQFVISRALELHGENLVLTGKVESAGEFEKTTNGWQWRTARGSVTLGEVKVFDASGKTLPATMQVTANVTRIEVAGAALAMAEYPVIIDPEIGANDFRISDMGPDGTTNFGTRSPAVAYNSVNNEYLVVWSGDDRTAPLVDDELEIYGQRLDAATGAEVGANDFRISDMGPDGSTSFDAVQPAVAYNSTNNEYLVTWTGDDDTTPLVDDEQEIYGQRLNAATGAEVGSNDFRISDMGPDGNASFRASQPKVAYNSINNEYFVVWYGDDNTAPLMDDEYEIFGQRIDAATGAEIGANDFRISDMGPDGNTLFRADQPAVTYNSTNNEYLVMWSGDDGVAPLVDDEREIYGQRLNAATGAEIGSNDFRISDMGPDGDPSFGAQGPEAVYNGTNNEYFVVWSGGDGIVQDEKVSEIYGQRLNAATGAEVGTNDFNISDMNSTASEILASSVAYNGTQNEYLVVWYADDHTPPLVDDEFEIYGQRLDAATGAKVGDNDFRLSDMGPDGNAVYEAEDPVVAFNSANNEYLVAWWGNDNTPPLMSNEFEIFGQRFSVSQEERNRVFLAEDLIRINQNVESEGTIRCNGRVIFGAGAPGTHNGRIRAVGDIDIGTQNTITADDVSSGGQVTLNGTATVFGAVNSNAGIGRVMLPVLSYAAGGASHTVPKGGSLSLTPGSYGTVRVRGHATLHLSAGNYFFQRLETLPLANLSLNVSGGAVNINVVDALNFAESVRVYVAGGLTSQVTFSTMQTTDLNIDRDAILRGTVNAPSAQVNFATGSAFKGELSAREIILAPRVKFLSHRSTLPFPKVSEVEMSEVAKSEVVTDYVLEQNYPNPFNPSTVIGFALPKASEVTLVIYNMNGQQVRELVAGKMVAGRHQVAWDATDARGERVASGVYMYVLKVGPSTSSGSTGSGSTGSGSTGSGATSSGSIGSGQVFAAKKKLVVMK